MATSNVSEEHIREGTQSIIKEAKDFKRIREPDTSLPNLAAAEKHIELATKYAHSLSFHVKQRIKRRGEGEDK